MTISPTTPIDPARCLAWIGCNDAKSQYLEGGPAWLAAETRKLHALGCAGIGHHLPMLEQGIVVGGVPQFGFSMVGWLRAAGGNFARIANTYGPRMLPLTRDGIRIVPYLGSLRLSPDLDRLTLAKLDDRMRLLAENIKPVTEAGMREVAFDGSVDYTPESKEGLFLDWLVAHGVGVWRESNPADFQAWAHMVPIIVANDTYLARKSMPQYASVKLTGPVIRMVKSPNGDGLSAEQWGEKWAQVTAPEIRDVIADGHQPAIENYANARKYAPQYFAGVNA